MKERCVRNEEKTISAGLCFFRFLFHCFLAPMFLPSIVFSSSFHSSSSLLFFFFLPQS